MRVDLNAGSAVQQDGLEKSAATRSREAARTETEQARFSGREVSVTSLARAALQAPEIRAEKVEALRAQIAAGHYQVSSHQIAGSIVEQLGSNKPGKT